MYVDKVPTGKNEEHFKNKNLKMQKIFYIYRICTE